MYAEEVLLTSLHCSHDEAEYYTSFAWKEPQVNVNIDELAELLDEWNCDVFSIGQKTGGDFRVVHVSFAVIHAL